jgi:hypothetical protein
MKIMQHAPIIVLALMALGLLAVKIYRPHGAVRVNAIGDPTLSLFALSRVLACRSTVMSAPELV